MKASRIPIVSAGLIVCLLLPGADAAQTTPPPAPRTLRINGYGEAHAAPNRATIKLAISTFAKDSRECAKRNATIAEKVVKALKMKLAGEGQVWTETYTLSPRYKEYPPNYPYLRPNTPPIIGYEARNIVGIRTREVNSLGPLIDSAIASGASGVDSLDFSLINDVKARAEAINKAAIDAQAQVRALSALGIKLKRPLDISVNVNNPPTYPYRYQSFSERGAPAGNFRPSTPIEAQETVVTAAVSITYEIE